MSKLFKTPKTLDFRSSSLISAEFMAIIWSIIVLVSSVAVCWLSLRCDNESRIDTNNLSRIKGCMELSSPITLCVVLKISSSSVDHIAEQFLHCRLRHTARSLLCDLELVTLVDPLQYGHFINTQYRLS